MKKIKTAALAISALALFTACGGGNDSEETVTSPTPEISADSEVPADTTSAGEGDEADGDLISDEEDINIDDVFPAESGEDADVTGDISGEEVSDNPLMPIIDKVLEESEWPTLMEVTDETILKDYFLLDNSDGKYEQMIVMQCPMSAQMSEIIIIKSSDSKSAFEALSARRQKAIDTDAWYPADKELADASIVGSNGDYAYFIIGINAEAAEKTILEQLPGGAPID